MKSLRLYIDTSVFGGYYDVEFDEETRKLFRMIKRGEYRIVLSDLTLKELLKAPPRVKGYNYVNLKNGYRTIDIRSPKDLIYYED